MVAGFDEDDVNAEGPCLDAQGFAQAFEREFGGAVEALKRNADEAADGSHVHDVAGFLGAHDGKRDAAHAQDTEKIHIELTLRFFDGGIFDGAGDAGAGVVDQHIEPAFARLDDFDGARDGGVVGDVERQ